MKCEAGMRGDEKPNEPTWMSEEASGARVRREAALPENRGRELRMEARKSAREAGMTMEGESGKPGWQVRRGRGRNTSSPD